MCRNCFTINLFWYLLSYNHQYSLQRYLVNNYNVIKFILLQQNIKKIKLSFIDNLKLQCKNLDSAENIYYSGNGIFAILSEKEKKRVLKKVIKG